MSLSYKVRQLYRLAQMGAWGAIQNPDIGQILKGMWGQQKHIVSTV